MRAAIYARKSNIEADDRDAEAKSVAVQLADAKAYILKKGWTVADEYIDDAVSGVAFGAARPGLARLLNALKPRPPFQALVMTEDSRLGRESIESAYVLKQIVESGVRVFLARDDIERKLDSAMDKIMVSLAGFGSELEREKVAQRTSAAMRSRAQRGLVAGGAMYGYQRVDGEMVIVPEQARIVERIFTEIAAGRGLATMAARLNHDGVPSPRPGRGWHMSGVRSIVGRDTYAGRMIWNKTKWVRRGGRRVPVARPESEWIVREVPSLRIISDEQWQAAQERLERTRQSYVSLMAGRHLGRPEAGLDSKYLLVGFAACARCGSGMHVAKRWGKTSCYFCTWHRQKGAAVCDNFLGSPSTRSMRSSPIGWSAISWPATSSRRSSRRPSRCGTPAMPPTTSAIASNTK